MQLTTTIHFQLIPQVRATSRLRGRKARRRPARARVGSGSRRRALGCFALGLLLVAGASAQTPKPSPAPEYDVRWGVKIPMRDGVELNATVYTPKGKAESATTMRRPVIFTLTPYISDTYHPRAAYFASHGYGFALVDVRGRGNSGGDFVTFVNEGRDGHDVVEWLAQQPFCDGHVAMWGGSYAGFDQWSTAKELPPHLSTIVPAAAVHPGVDAPHYNNIGQPYVVRWLTFTNGHAGQEQLFGDSDYWATKFLSAYRQHIPFKSLDSFVGTPFPNFQRFVQHPTRDDYYEAVTPSADQFKKITMPILTITGQYDGDEYGALTYYRDHLANAAPEAHAKHFLIIGPWDHAGTRSPTVEVDGVKFGSAALLDLNDLHRQWYDWTMKKGPRPAFLKKLVAYYLLAPGNAGADGEWTYAESLAELTEGARSFYLDSKDGNANGVFHSGTLSEAMPKEGSDHFIYDPLDTHRGETLENPERAKNFSRLDQSYALSIAEDGLVYHTAPFAAETPLVGCPSLRLWVSLDTPDTDLQADLAEIQPDGTSIQLWSDSRRLRYRESPREAKLVKPGDIVACDFAPGLFIARRLMKGSRLRLIISGQNSINTEKNYNSGGVVAEETAKDARTADVQIYHDEGHPSVLQLPLAQITAAQAR